MADEIYNSINKYQIIEVRTHGEDLGDSGIVGQLFFSFAAFACTAQMDQGRVKSSSVLHVCLLGTEGGFLQPT